MAKDMNRQLTETDPLTRKKEGILKVFKHIKGCSAFFIVRDMPMSSSLSLPTVRRMGNTM